MATINKGDKITMLIQNDFGLNVVRLGRVHEITAIDIKKPYSFKTFTKVLYIPKGKRNVCGFTKETDCPLVVWTGWHNIDKAFNTESGNDIWHSSFSLGEFNALRDQVNKELIILEHTEAS